MRKKYNTPKRDQVVKTRLTQEEKTAFEEKCGMLGMSQSKYLRQMITAGKIKTKIFVSNTSEETLDALGKMTHHLSRIGGNLNQIAYRLNRGEPADGNLCEEVRSSLSELSEIRFDLEKKAGEIYGNHQTLQL